MGLDVKKTRTTTTLNATVSANAAPITAATVKGSVYGPAGQSLATDTIMAHLGNGVYALVLAADKTAAEGTYVADITATYAGQTSVNRYEFYLQDS